MHTLHKFPLPPLTMGGKGNLTQEEKSLLFFLQHTPPSQLTLCHLPFTEKGEAEKRRVQI